jgi:drug/metabolite transporter (DMT)-like permease
VVAATRASIPRSGLAWAHLAGAAVLLNAVPFTLFAVGEQHVSSVLAGIWNATTPLVTLLVVLALLPAERPTQARVSGLAIGFLGVLVVLAPWRGLGGPELWGNLACLCAAACYGLGFPYTRRFLADRPESGIVLSACQLVLASVGLGVVAAVAAPAITRPPSWPVIASMVGLGALGSGLAYVLNYRVVRAAGATTASTVTYLIPLFSTVAGVTVLGEPLTWNQPVGAFVVLVGVGVSQGLIRLRKT